MPKHHHFASALQRVIQARDATRGAQSAYAEIAGLEQATFSRYLTGRSRPNVNWLERIIHPLTDAERAEVVVAYLRDDVPESARDLVRITSLIDEPLHTAEEPADAIAALPKKKKEVIYGLAREMQNQAVWEALEATWRMMKSR